MVHPHLDRLPTHTRVELQRRHQVAPSATSSSGAPTIKFPARNDSVKKIWENNAHNYAREMMKCSEKIDCLEWCSYIKLRFSILKGAGGRAAKWILGPSEVKLSGHRSQSGNCREAEGAVSVRRVLREG